MLRDVMTNRSRLIAVAASVGFMVAAARGQVETRPIDAGHSTLTVFVYKSGLFSAFADNHVIKAPIASGSISEESAPRVELAVHAADLTVIDPGVSADRRAEVQTRMLGPDVLDTATFPDITFTSTTIVPAGTDRWNVSGRLMIHGQTRVITFAVARLNGRYRGDVAIKQRDFGIEPITIGGGAVKVKDELKIQFDLGVSPSS
jgi:polyisoprenoid-binding protein YceI